MSSTIRMTAPEATRAPGATRHRGRRVRLTERETLTSVEETLIARGRAEQVIAVRGSLQDAMEPEGRAVVEGALGRPVVAFLGQVHREARGPSAPTGGRT